MEPGGGAMLLITTGSCVCGCRMTHRMAPGRWLLEPALLCATSSSGVSLSLSLSQSRLVMGSIHARDAMGAAPMSVSASASACSTMLLEQCEHEERGHVYLLLHLTCWQWRPLAHGCACHPLPCCSCMCRCGSMWWMRHAPGEAHAWVCRWRVPLCMRCQGWRLGQRH